MIEEEIVVDVVKEGIEFADSIASVVELSVVVVVVVFDTGSMIIVDCYTECWCVGGGGCWNIEMTFFLKKRGNTNGSSRTPTNSRIWSVLVRRPVKFMSFSVASLLRRSVW